MLTIRAATIADAPQIAAFNVTMAAETEDKPLDLATVTRGVRRLFEDESRGLYFIAERDGDIVGQTMVTYEWSDWRDGRMWWIQSVYVVPEARRTGVFRALYDAVIRAAGEDPDARGIRLYVETDNQRAKATYVALGMKPCVYDMYEALFASPDASAPSPKA